MLNRGDIIVFLLERGWYVEYVNGSGNDDLSVTLGEGPGATRRSHFTERRDSK